MAVKDVVRYYNEIADQYLEMQEELNDFTELAKQGMFEPERLEAIEKSVEPLKTNYERISYIMFLLNKPARKEKQNKYNKTYDRHGTLRQHCNEERQENASSLESLRSLKGDM